jgi:ribonucleoside-diphosphate reductase alpha chain
MSIHITKRDGSSELLNYDKIHKVLFWGTEGLKDVTVSDIEMNAHLKIYDGITSNEIHQVLIQSCADLITEKTPNYQYVASKLLSYYLRKEVYNSAVDIPTIQYIMKKNIKSGVYDSIIENYYDDEELDTINDYIKHERDFTFSYAGIRQLIDKYLLKNRSTSEIFETPQIMYMMISMTLFKDYKGDKRLQYIRKFYNAISQFKINLPTPVMCGVRTCIRQYSSCTLVDVGDTMDSIIHSDAAITKYTSQRAGIGINVGRIRAVNSTIRHGEVVHTGVIPFLKKFAASVKSCTQNGIRGGSATVHYPFWHLEFEDLIVLKNNKGTEDNRVRTMDYSIQLNKTFYKRVKENKDITLFSPHEVPELYEAFFGDSDEFEKIYKKCEKDDSLKKKTIKAIDAFKTICSEKFETGRIYIMNVDHCNTHSSFLSKIYMSNLCQEITLPTDPIEHYDDGLGENGEISLCVLSGVNMGKVNIKELPNICDLIVRALDFVIENQSYPLNAAKKITKRRSIGVGVVNLAYFLAKNKTGYEDNKSIELVDEYFEHFQYNLITASVNLAKEFGKCEYSHLTKYSKGILPIDTYNKNIDSICNRPLSCDWETLRGELLEHGIRNSTLSAIMPSESSAVVSNATNGIEPPRSLVSFKKSKKGILTQVVPEIEKYKQYYTTAFDMKNNKGYLNICGVIQKYIDQAISVNNYYNPSKYEGGNQPISEIMTDIFYHYSLGGKTMYYSNTADGKTDSDLVDTSITKKEIEKNEPIVKDTEVKIIVSVDTHITSKNDLFDSVEEMSGCAGGACSL